MNCLRKPNSFALMWFCFKVMNVPEKLLSTAGSPQLLVGCVESFDNDLLYEVENHVGYIIAVLNDLLQKSRDELLSDHGCLHVINLSKWVVFTIACWS